MLVFETDEGPVHFNNTPNPQSIEKGGRVGRSVKAACKMLEELPHQIPIDDAIKSAMDLILDSNVILSAWWFYGKETAVHKEVCRYFVMETTFGFDLYERLDAVGAFSFLEKLKPSARRHADGAIMRLLAPFVISSAGVDSVESAPLEFIHSVVDTYRTDEGRRWRKEVFGSSEIVTQCAKNVVTGLFKIYGDPNLLIKSSVGRRAGAEVGSKIWDQLRASTDPLDQEVVALADDVLKKTTIAPKTVPQGCYDILSWLRSEYPGMSLLDVLTSKARPVTFTEFLKRRKGSITNYVVSQTICVKRLLDHFTGQMVDENPVLMVYPLISEAEMALTRAAGPPPGKKPSHSKARPLPIKLFALVREILSEGEGGWPGQSGHFNVELMIDGKPQTIFCPVIPTLLLCATHLPLRIGQWRRLDSGEGDRVQFNSDTGQWENNPGPLAGFWAAEEDGTDVPTHGYAHRFEESTTTGIFVNTNKTGSPYVLPWQHEFILGRLWALREWQQKYNPIDDAIGPDEYLDAPDRMPERTKRGMPRIHALFRLFPTSDRPFKGRIVTGSEVGHAWQYVMAEAQRRWNEREPSNQIDIVKFNSITGQPSSCIYNLHGLRVRGLTDLYRARVPMEILSKLVAGHATFMMTRYYLEWDPDKVHQLLEAGAIEAAAQHQRELIDGLKSWNYEQARKRTVALEAAAIEEAVSSPSKLEYCNVDIGVCPFDCTRCWDGGPIDRKETVKNGPDKHTYKSVPTRNCVICRHFVTGPEWMNQLEWYGSKLCEQRKHLALLEKEIVEKVDELRARFDSGAVTKAEYLQKYDAFQSELMPVLEEQELVQQGIFNTDVLLAACGKLLDEMKPGDAPARIVWDKERVTEFVEVDHFEFALFMSVAARHYPLLGDPRIRNALSSHLNRIAFNGGIVPPELNFKSTEAQRRKCADLFADFMVRRTTALQRKQLVDGSSRLQDFGIHTEMQTLVSSVMDESFSLDRRESLLLEAQA
ncbi:VPA1269 family protein [Rhizobium phaseoli]|uniref:VPA1269 family protein n=1 Tax=Rhizobium phaseoli TaxID=396 RepID=UPI0007EB6E56|nr:VPA1269 family protein [Rhizobium phaseoli]ANL42413.1 phage integrase protein [Rhizobium phaseoli]ANL61399.1 phage integrase protein [Rhizobium phaseoli]